MANTTNNMYHPPSYVQPPETSDDISLILRQILFKSSSKQIKCETQPPGAPNIPLNAFASSSVDYDPDIEYDSESEEGLGHLMEEMSAKPDPPRNPSKRTRAAEVHNMSEKRRRSRINEKMKALQKLIPNSDKTDKASMLDEAIEYLKQLQLQVQMLTMRNGINLYSMCEPNGFLQPNHRPSGMSHGNQSIHMTANHGPLVNQMLLTHNQPSILDFSRTINQDPSYGTQLGSS